MGRSKKRPAKWRQAQKQKTTERKVKQTVLGLCFIGLILMLTGFNWLWQKASLSLWDGRANFGVVEAEEAGFKLKIYLPSEPARLEMVIPENVMVWMSRDLGEYQLKSVFELGELDQGNGGKLLTRTVQEMMGVGVKGFKVKDRTNLSWWDEWRLLWFKLKNSQLKAVNLKELGVLEEKSLNDGGKIYRLNEGLMDEWLNQNLFDWKIVEEDLSIALVNASGVEGVAKTVSRLVSNLGGEVRLLRNGDVSEKSRILVGKQEDKKLRTVKVLSGVLGIKEVVVGEVEDFRTQMVIFIAKDYTEVY